VAALATRFVQAFEEGDVEEIVALLTEDVVLRCCHTPSARGGARK
jgi:hypothetical protein